MNVGKAELRSTYNVQRAFKNYHDWRCRDCRSIQYDCERSHLSSWGCCFVEQDISACARNKRSKLGKDCMSTGAR
jgi:hypothetical protein